MGCVSCIIINKVNCTNISWLTPLFNEHAVFAAMVKHGITVQNKAVQFLNYFY